MITIFFINKTPINGTLYACDNGATTFSIMTLSIMTLSITTFSIMTLSIKGLFITININNNQHNNTSIMLGVFMLSVAFYLLLC